MGSVRPESRAGHGASFALEGLPSTNQPLRPGESVTRYYVITPSELDALLADRLRPREIRVYAQDVRIR